MHKNTASVTKCRPLLPLFPSSSVIQAWTGRAQQCTPHCPEVTAEEQVTLSVSPLFSLQHDDTIFFVLFT